MKILPKNGVVIVQDMEILPHPELGVCPYVAKDLKELFEENGLECILTRYDSYRGIPLYTLTCKKVEEPKAAKIISDRLLSIREIRLNAIEEQLYTQIDKKKTEDGFLCLAQHFDYVAIQKQISEYKKEKSPLSEFEIFRIT